MFEMTRFPVAVVGPVVDEFNASHLPYSSAAAIPCITWSTER